MANSVLRSIEGIGFKKTIWKPIGQAMADYKMISKGDRIAVGISGGKDSLTLLNAIVRVRYLANIDFEVYPIHIRSWLKDEDIDIIKKHCSDLGEKLIVENSNIDKIDLGKNPCFLCSRLRRGILYHMMEDSSIKKLALGHHKDDIIETFLMNIFYQGNMKIMRPAYHSLSHDLDIIRPLAYVEEQDIIIYSKSMDMPIVHSQCPYGNGDTSKRERIKQLIRSLSDETPDIRSTIFNAIVNHK